MMMMMIIKKMPLSSCVPSNRSPSITMWKLSIVVVVVCLAATNLPLADAAFASFPSNAVTTSKKTSISPTSLSVSSSLSSLPSSWRKHHEQSRGGRNQLQSLLFAFGNNNFNDPPQPQEEGDFFDAYDPSRDDVRTGLGNNNDLRSNPIPPNPNNPNPQFLRQQRQQNFVPSSPLSPNPQFSGPQQNARSPLSPSLSQQQPPPQPEDYSTPLQFSRQQQQEQQQQQNSGPPFSPFSPSLEQNYGSGGGNNNDPPLNQFSRQQQDYGYNDDNNGPPPPPQQNNPTQFSRQTQQNFGYDYDDDDGRYGGQQQYNDNNDDFTFTRQEYEYTYEDKITNLLDDISDFCQGTQDFCRNLVPVPFRPKKIQPAGTAGDDPLSKLTSGPELPGISRPVWLATLGSIVTIFNWYGYYKFCIEEELYYYELEQTGRATTCGGYGTMVPYVYGVLIGLPCIYYDIPGNIGYAIMIASTVWLTLGQMNLYRRVNELTQEAKDYMYLDYNEYNGNGKMLYEFWAVLPPPFNVIVALRQIYFLSEYWRLVRNDPPTKDYIAESIFPSISERRRYTAGEFIRNPKLWYWFFQPPKQKPNNKKQQFKQQQNIPIQQPNNRLVPPPPPPQQQPGFPPQQQRSDDNSFNY